LQRHYLWFKVKNYFDRIIFIKIRINYRVSCKSHSYLCRRWRVADARPSAGVNRCGCTFLTARGFATGRLKSNERIRITELLSTWTIVCAFIGIHGVHSSVSYQWYNARCYYELSRYCLPAAYPLGIKHLNTFSELLWIIWRTFMSFSQACLDRQHIFCIVLLDEESRSRIGSLGLG